MVAVVTGRAGTSPSPAERGPARLGPARLGPEGLGPVRLGPVEIPAGSLAIMAVINRTPDSFFDRGATYAFGAALAAVDRAVADGARIVDIGGVKAGPGDEVDVAEEIRRVAGLVAAVRERYPHIAISVDTWRAEVGKVVAEAGADLLNDTWGGVDPGLAEVAATYRTALVCAHAGGLPPRTRPHRIAYADVVAEVASGVSGLAERAVAAGVRPDGILIDPAHDFGKNTRHSLELTRRLAELVETGWPVLAALADKDFIGESLDRPPGQRGTGTIAALAVSAWQGARVFRVHDVAAARQALNAVAAMRDETAGSGRPARPLRPGRPAGPPVPPVPGVPRAEPGNPGQPGPALR